ncbi:histidinol dehydrogenase [candidate division KSB3 bacterium]|uniref:Histidinol dehydrogenase n=1 Tax=candidate division KSB3 bacterium TaxID=2044937 RepID=A0A2G6E333_9BACT|nr:MAG: histidinol dehydrogenase [candidate division KSB3 bacterium]PIE28937.1 MAG: histidinol dehydrogenase [candidate division KSB3 bacterium]
MNLFKLWELSQEKRAKLLERTQVDAGRFVDVVRPVIDDIKEHGDAAVVKYTQKFDGAAIPADKQKVTTEEIQAAYQFVDDRLLAALKTSADNIRTFHEFQKSEEFWIKEIAPGVFAGEQTSPIDSVALYVPRGKGSFPSVMLMLGIPAVVAGVESIYVFSPPLPNGSSDPATLVAADICGIRNIFKVGGSQAIAAVAFGTESIPKAEKVVGPGNPYVTAAKRLLQSVVDPGLPAGPSEALILADEHADPYLAALDLLNEAEHGPDSSAYLVTNSLKLAENALQQLPGLLEKLPAQRKEYCEAVLSGQGGIVVTKTLDEAIAFVNEYAPEHLAIHVNDLIGVTRRIRNAGEIILGDYTPISVCNYSLGPNAVLPTSGFAKTFSALSVRDFMKTSSISYLTKTAYEDLRDHVIHFAEYEGFAAHAMTLKERKFPHPDLEDPAGFSRPETELPDLGSHILKASRFGVLCQRVTREATITVEIDRGARYPDINEKLKTPLHFLNHMVEHISWRSCMNIAVETSVTHYPFGHVICEDLGLTMGFAFAELRRQHIAEGVNGDGEAIAIIDEGMARAVISFEDRAQFHFSSAVTIPEHVEDMLSTDLNQFFDGFSQGARCTIHIDILKGRDPHHIWESVFRAFGKSLKHAFEANPWRQGTTPGVKGI